MTRHRRAFLCLASLAWRGIDTNLVVEILSRTTPRECGCIWLPPAPLHSVKASNIPHGGAAGLMVATE